MTAVIRCAIVGPGRSRNGLGPFLARFAERAGMRVVAACGRDPERTRAATVELGSLLGHEVLDFVDLERMRDRVPLDALIVAAPPEAHLAALRFALARGLHVLCEKPLVPVGASAAVDALCEGFVAAGLALVENCQWPEVLPAFDRLHPGHLAAPRSFGLGLSPAFSGRAMLEDSLSHFISLAQALAPIDERSCAELIAAPQSLEAVESADFEVLFHGPAGALTGRLELRRVPVQPRPAWIAIDGLRADREIRLPGYELSWRSADGRSERSDDPMGRLVYGFADLIRERPLDRIRAQSDRVRTRARLYRVLVEACD